MRDVGTRHARQDVHALTCIRPPFLPHLAYIPKSQGHYIEALGNQPVKLLETFKNEKFSQVSLSNWLALTPPNIVASHTGWSKQTISKLQQFKTQDYQVVQGDNDGSGKPINQNKKRGLLPYGGKQMWA